MNKLDGELYFMKLNLHNHGNSCDADTKIDDEDITIQKQEIVAKNEAQSE